MVCPNSASFALGARKEMRRQGGKSTAIHPKLYTSDNKDQQTV